MRKRSKLLGAVVVGGIAMLLVNGMAAIAAPCLLYRASCSPRLPIEVALDARVVPQELPRRKATPIGLRVRGRVATKDGSQPPALREAVLAIDKKIEIDVEGLSVCGYGDIVSKGSSAARAACRASIVGSGNASARLAYPENFPITVKSDLTVFNAGVKDGVMRLFAHAHIPIPRPRAIIARVEIAKRGTGRFGWKATVDLPRIGDGYGSVIDFSLRLKRSFLSQGEKKSYLSARCADGKLRLEMPKLHFRNEAQMPQSPTSTVLKGIATIPCTPAG